MTHDTEIRGRKTDVGVPAASPGRKAIRELLKDGARTSPGARREGP
jgi:hypothetical protein